MKRSCTLCKASFILQDSLGICKCVVSVQESYVKT